MEKLKQWQMTELNKEFSLVESDLPAINENEAGFFISLYGY